MDTILEFVALVLLFGALAGSGWLAYKDSPLYKYEKERKRIASKKTDRPK